jgi:hypothetical protein
MGFGFRKYENGYGVYIIIVIGRYSLTIGRSH